MNILSVIIILHIKEARKPSPNSCLFLRNYDYDDDVFLCQPAKISFFLFREKFHLHLQKRLLDITETRELTRRVIYTTHY